MKSIVEKIKKCYRYYKFPKYAIFKGVSVYKTYFFLGKDLESHEEYYWCYSLRKKTFMKKSWIRVEEGYRKDNIFIRIWTLKELLKVARIFKKENSLKSYTCVRNHDFWSENDPSPDIQKRP